jgi:ABC-type multidrug transport system fused ATPase/permease subunit
MLKLVRTAFSIISLSGLRQRATFALLILLFLGNGVFEGLAIFNFARLFDSFAKGTAFSSLSIKFVGYVAVATFLRVSSVRASCLYSAELGNIVSTDAYELLLEPSKLVSVQSDKGTALTLVTSKATRVVTDYLNPIIQSIGLAFVVIGIVVTLFLSNPRSLITIVLFIAVSYSVIISVLSPRLIRNSTNIAESEKRITSTVMDSIAGYRETIIYNLSPYFIDSFRQDDLLNRRSQTSNIFFSLTPRYFVELSGILAIVLIFILSSVNRGEATSVLGGLAGLALGSQRLLPAVQQIYQAWSSAQGAQASVEEILTFINSGNAAQKGRESLSRSADSAHPISSEARLESLLPISTLRLRNVTFSYPQSSSNLFDHTDLVIQGGQKVAFTGESGSGKTTLLDLFSGLLAPTEGVVQINDVDIQSVKLTTSSGLYQLLSVIPQRPHLISGSIIHNITLLPFGKEYLIDMPFLYECMKACCLDEFCHDYSPNKDKNLSTNVTSLSGGQLQRVAMARCLYRRSPIILMDEPTSALDLNTETLILNNIFNFIDVSQTVIAVTHRPKLLDYVDIVYRVDGSGIKPVVN